MNVQKYSDRMITDRQMSMHSWWYWAWTDNRFFEMGIDSLETVGEHKWLPDISNKTRIK